MSLRARAVLAKPDKWAQFADDQLRRIVRRHYPDVPLSEVLSASRDEMVEMLRTAAEKGAE